MDKPRSKQMQTQEEQIKASIQNALDLASRCRSVETSENYEFLEEQVDQVEAQARQGLSLELDLDSLLEKLDARQPITPPDLKTLETLIVGDAESYLKYESELAGWKAQLARALDQIEALAKSDMNLDGIMQLRALCREAHESLSDLIFYFDAQERVAKFKAATSGPIDAEGYLFLAQIVRAMLRSDRM
jgi:hypothetical protein